jgi:leucyl aminopeptidase
MDIGVRSTPLGRHSDEAAVVLLFEGDAGRRTVTAAGKGFAAPYGALCEAKTFQGGVDEVRVLHAGPSERIRILVVAGLGPIGKATLETVRRASAAGLRAARDAGARSASVLVPGGPKAWLRADRAAQAVVEGGVIGLYRFETYLTRKSPTGIDALTVLAPRGETARVEKGVESGRAVGEAVCLARDLGNQPGNVATPTYLAETARRIADERGLALRVLEEEDMLRLGMGGLLGVSQGSLEPAKLIILTYEPKGRKKVDTVALVGKGLTFDSGGISIKPGAKMEDMKFDMCGGAAVLATMQAVAALQVPVRVVGLVPASENLPDGGSYKPGDILTAMNGVTIEVKNTDAEGRLILADALAYATSKLRPKPKAVVDLATLTGACVVALGDQYAGLVSNDDALAARVAEAGEAAGDLAWRLPINEGYRKQLKSAYADIANLGTPPGAGTITAAAFLEKFVGTVPWAHLDIAGVAWTERADGYLTKGGTGAGVRLLCRLLAGWKR